MNFLLNFIILITIVYILYVYVIEPYYKEHFCNNLNGLIHPSYVPGVNVINQQRNIPSFNINKQCNDPNLKPYLGWKCYANELQKSNINECTNWKGTPFYNYLKNNPLKFDGIWDEKCNKNNCIWKMSC